MERGKKDPKGGKRVAEHSHYDKKEENNGKGNLSGERDGRAR